VVDGKRKKKKGKRSQKENLDDLKREMEMVGLFIVWLFLLKYIDYEFWLGK